MNPLSFSERFNSYDPNWYPDYLKCDGKTKILSLETFFPKWNSNNYVEEEVGMRIVNLDQVIGAYSLDFCYKFDKNFRPYPDHFWDKHSSFWFFHSGFVNEPRTKVFKFIDIDYVKVKGKYFVCSNGYTRTSVFKNLGFQRIKVLILKIVRDDFFLSHK